MDPRIAIWNTLHDGQITVMSQEGTDLIMFVSIPYLRRRLKPIGDSFALRLTELRSIEAADWEETKRTSFFPDIAMSGLVILSTESTGMPVRVVTNQGFLTLDFNRLEIRLDTGQVVDYETVDAACDQYWDEWSARAKEAKNPA